MVIFKRKKNACTTSQNKVKKVIALSSGQFSQDSKHVVREAKLHKYFNHYMDGTPFTLKYHQQQQQQKKKKKKKTRKRMNGEEKRHQSTDTTSIAIDHKALGHEWHTSSKPDNNCFVYRVSMQLTLSTPPPPSDMTFAG